MSRHVQQQAARQQRSEVHAMRAEPSVRRRRVVERVVHASRTRYGGGVPPPVLGIPV